MSDERGSFEEALFIVKPIETPTITEHSIRVGGPCSNEKLEAAKRLFNPKGFRAWLKSDEARGLVPETTVEATEITGIFQGDESERMALALAGAEQRRILAAERAKQSKGGKKGKTTQIENAKVKRLREKSLRTKKNAPRVVALIAFKERHPDATLPEAARELVSRGLMGECGDPERAAKKWIRDHAEELPAFTPGRSGHPLGVPNSRKP